MSEFLDNIHAVREAAQADFKDKPLKNKFAFLGGTALLALHEAGMETAAVGLGTHMYEWTHNPIAVAASLGALSLSIESALSVGVSRSMQSFKRVSEEIKNRYFISQAMEPDRPTRASKIRAFFDVAFLAFTLGSPGVLARDYLKHPDKTYESRKKVGFRAARYLAGMNASLGLILGGASWIAEKFGTDDVSKTVIEAGHSPITYSVIGAYVLGRLSDTTRKNHKLRKQLREQQFDAV